MAEENTKPNEGYLARFFQRDSDTLLTWGNTGLMMFRIFHEWADSFDPASGSTGQIEGESKDIQTGAFEPNCTTGTAVFNGRLSGLWDCVEKAWPDDLAQMYRAMRAAGFNADNLWEMYQKFRTQWCEALYGVDAMGYANTGRFDMAYGDKSEALRYILRARFRYLDSKYGANTSAPLEFRLWGNGRGVALRYYCALYASLNWGAGGIRTVRAITAGEPSFFPNPGTTFNETTFTVYNADLLTEISTYTELPDGTRTEGGLQGLATRCSVSGLANCKRLKKLEFDYSEGEANTNLDGRVLDACKSVALRSITVRNCPNVTGHADFASQVIETIDLRGTGVTGVTVPETDTLKTLRFGPAVSSIELSHLTGLQTLTADGMTSLASIKIDACPKLDIRPLLYEALGGATLREVKITGVDWKSFAVNYLEKLADLGAEITGNITLASTANMSFALKQKCVAAWGNIDSESNPLQISYTSRPVDIIRISGAGYFGEPGDYQLKVVSEDPLANDFTKIEWSMTPNTYAEIDTLTGRVHVSRVGTEELAPTAEVSVTVTKADGTTVGKSTTIGFYARTCKLGDIVYADGTYSDVYDEGKTVVCICCYIDPNDPTRRLGVAPIAVSDYSRWGPHTELTLSDANLITSDIPQIPNIYFDTSIPAIDLFLDDTELDGFKHHEESDLYRAGFISLKFDFGEYSEGDIVPIGKYETMCIIQMRNRVLRDSGINLEVPKATEGESELDCLDRLLAATNAAIGNGHYYYYPAASIAYAYQPKVQEGEVLSSKFTAHQWFLPTPGDLQRLRCLLTTRDEFERLKMQGVTNFVHVCHTTGEHSTPANCYKLNILTGKPYGGEYSNFSKALNNAVVFPMVQF